MLNPIFEKFVEKSPVSVIARGMMERVLNPEQLDDWFEQTAEKQYTKELLFSTVFDIMSQVVSGSKASVHLACQASKENICVSMSLLIYYQTHTQPTTCSIIRHQNTPHDVGQF